MKYSIFSPPLAAAIHTLQFATHMCSPLPAQHFASSLSWLLIVAACVSPVLLQLALHVHICCETRRTVHTASRCHCGRGNDGCVSGGAWTCVEPRLRCTAADLRLL